VVARGVAAVDFFGTFTRDAAVGRAAMGRFRRVESADCPVCGRRVGVVNPRQGDGTLRRPLPHKTAGSWCEGRFHALEHWDEEIVERDR
jgi:hypothetical protein